MESKIVKDDLLQHKEEFETVYGIISAHKKRAMNAMHNESLNMLWEVGAYVSDRLKKAVWGDGVVRMLAEYIHTRSPSKLFVSFSVKSVKSGWILKFLGCICPAPPLRRGQAGW